MALVKAGDVFVDRAGQRLRVVDRAPEIVTWGWWVLGSNTYEFEDIQNQCRSYQFGGANGFGWKADPKRQDSNWGRLARGELLLLVLEREAISPDTENEWGPVCP